MKVNDSTEISHKRKAFLMATIVAAAHGISKSELVSLPEDDIKKLEDYMGIDSDKISHGDIVHMKRQDEKEKTEEFLMGLHEKYKKGEGKESIRAKKLIERKGLEDIPNSTKKPKLKIEIDYIQTKETQIPPINQSTKNYLIKLFDRYGISLDLDLGENPGDHGGQIILSSRCKYEEPKDYVLNEDEKDCVLIKSKEKGGQAYKITGERIDPSGMFIESIPSMDTARKIKEAYFGDNEGHSEAVVLYGIVTDGPVECTEEHHYVEGCAETPGNVFMVSKDESDLSRFRKIFMHEIGHNMGEDHSEDTGNIMHRTIANNGDEFFSYNQLNRMINYLRNV